jgi:hypothetical protein
MATNHSKRWQKKNSHRDPDMLEDASIVGTFLLHPVLPHNLLLTLAAHNEREVRPQSSLRNPMRGWGPRSSCHLWLSILIFIWWGHGLHAYDHAWRITWRPTRSTRASKSRRRPKAYPVRVTKVEAQIKFESTSESRTSLPWTGHPGRVRTPFLMIHIWMESLFDKEANPSGPTSKDVWNQRESSK